VLLEASWIIFANCFLFDTQQISALTLPYDDQVRALSPVGGQDQASYSLQAIAGSRLYATKVSWDADETRCNENE
jgi:hypothetical protein